MKEYSYYNKNGTITKVCKLKDDTEADMNLEEGLKWVEGAWDYEKYVVIKGKPVEAPERPGFPCEFDPETFQWVVDKEFALSMVKAHRNKLLSESDWTQVSDAPVDKKTWKAYRKELRDLPNKITNFNNIPWPQQPDTKRKK